MQVSRDDEIPSVPANIESLHPNYYVQAPMYSGMYGYDAMHPGVYGYAPYTPYQQQIYPMAAPLPVPYPDQADIMSVIPTLRCWSCSKCGNLNYAHRLTCNLRKCQRMSEIHNSTGGAEPDWMCACGNVNYRFRKYCNLRKCQLPQIGNPFLFFGISQLIRAGYAPQTALSLLLTNTAHSPDASDWISGERSSTSSNKISSASPENGCWQCKECGNLNWSWREECNRKGCCQLKKDSIINEGTENPE